MEHPEQVTSHPSSKLLLFKVDEASVVLANMPASTIRKFVAKGLLKYCVHLGRRPYYFTRQHLDDFISNHMGGNSESGEN